VAELAHRYGRGRLLVFDLVATTIVLIASATCRRATGGQLSTM